MGLRPNRLSVRGSVLDPSGAGIAGATVQLQSPDGALVSQSRTDPKEISPSPISPLGTSFSRSRPTPDLPSQTLPIHLTANVSGIKITLNTESVHQEITVGADQSLSTDPSANRDTITTTGDELRKLPVFDQDYIAALTPFLDASSGSSGGVTIIVDGVEMKSAGVSASAIQEVRVNNDPYSAEFTRPGRGRIEITTKPGSPDLPRRSQLHLPRRHLQREELLFASSGRQRLAASTKAISPAPSVAAATPASSLRRSYRQHNTAAVVNAIGPSGPINENVLTPNRNSQSSIRLTHDFSSDHRLSIGYNFEASNSTNAGVGGITLPEAGYNLNSREDDAIFNDRIIVTPNLINQLQITFEKDEDVTSSVTEAQSIQVSGSFIGGGAQADLARTENTIHVNEIVTWSHGKHYIRAGVQLPQFSRRAVDDHTNRLGTFRFSSLATYSASTPYVFTAQQGVGRGFYWINEFGSFIQDQVKLTPKLQLSLGLRYDWQTFLPDNNNFAPRVSLAYAPGKGKTIIRTGTGVFYDRTGGDFPATVKLHNGIVLHSVQIQNPTFPLAPHSDFSALPTNLVQFDQHIRRPTQFSTASASSISCTNPSP